MAGRFVVDNACVLTQNDARKVIPHLPSVLAYQAHGTEVRWVWVVAAVIEA